MLDLTPQERSALESGEPISCKLEQTECIVVRKDVFERLQRIAYDDTDWTPEEMLALAARTFDDADRGEAIQ